MAMAVAIETTTATYCRLSVNNIPNIQPKVKPSPIEIVKRVANFQFTSPFLLSLFPMFDSCQHTTILQRFSHVGWQRAIDWYFMVEFHLRSWNLDFVSESIAPFKAYTELKSTPYKNTRVFFVFSLFPFYTSIFTLLLYLASFVHRFHVFVILPLLDRTATNKCGEW